MRFARTFVLAFLSLALTVSLAQPARPGGQTSTPATQSSPQAVVLLQKSLAALTGGNPITDVTLSGTARRIAGSDDESGTATFKALGGTGSRIDLTLPSGSRNEIRSVSGGYLTGSWSGPDGVSHSISYHNLLTDSGIFPTFTLSSFASSASAALTYVGAETRNGISVIHLGAQQLPPGIAGDLPRHLSQMEIFLDASTNLPLFFDFSIHADTNALVDIPVEIRFSDYTAVNGAQIPLHIQKYINNSLVLDLQFQSAVLNSGLTAAQVGAQ